MLDDESELDIAADGTYQQEVDDGNELPSTVTAPGLKSSDRTLSVVDNVADSDAKKQRKNSMFDGLRKFF